MKRYWFAAVLLLVPLSVEAASLKICWDDASQSTDVTTIQAAIDGAVMFPDVLLGSTLALTKRCNTVPIPANFPRGKDLSMTLRAVNAYGEPGGDSNSVVFRSPSIPGKLTGATVQIVVP